ncbi:MAG TPA: hypothetical protein VGL48_04060 [Acidimicrobiales bacterium]
MVAAGVFFTGTAAFFVGSDAFFLATGVAFRATVFFATAAPLLAAGTVLTAARFLIGTDFFAGDRRDAGTFLAAVTLLAGVIVSSFPTTDVAGSLTTTASRERVTIADGNDQGQYRLFDCR